MNRQLLLKVVMAILWGSIVATCVLFIIICFNFPDKWIAYLPYLAISMIITQVSLGVFKVMIDEI